MVGRCRVQLCGRLSRWQVSIRENIQRALESLGYPSGGRTIEQLQVSELQRILDDPTLTAQRQSSLNPRGFFQDGETTRLAVPRGLDTQQLTFLRAGGRMSGRSGYNSGQPVTMNYANPDRHVIDPLQKWITQNIENRKFASVADARATECLPSN